MPGCDSTRRLAGTLTWIGSLVIRSNIPASHSAVRWLATAPTPAYRAAAHTRLAGPTGPVKVA